jgi:hypothetical protein
MKLGRITSAALGAVCVLASTSAFAADKYTVLLLDQTGSMSVEGSAPGVSRWEDAVKAAAYWVNEDRTTAGNQSRAYAIWTFKTGADGSKPIYRVWPSAGNEDDDCAAVGAVYEADFGFCSIGGGDGFAFNLLSARMLDCANGPCILEEQFAVAGPTTPLAQSLCEILAEMRPKLNTRVLNITLESDGEENISTGLCAGTTAADYTLNKAVVDWGVPVGSWQNKVLRAALGYNQPSQETAVNTPLPANGAFPSYLEWRVDVHYRLIPSSASSLMALSAAVPVEGDGPALRLAPTPTTSSFAAGVAAAGTLTPSMSAGELKFFQALGTGNSKSRFREIVQVPGQVFGTYHKLPGDVDDSGCTDMADYQIIKQSDVWLKRAVLPLQIAMRADLNKDGWVDYGDLDVLFAHWGQGCINPVPPHPAN